MARFWTAFTLGALAASLVFGVVGGFAVRLLTPSPREKFMAPTFSLDLAPGWTCAQEGTETVCTVGPRPHPAMAIFALKYRGPQDSLDAYAAHLDGIGPTPGTATPAPRSTRRWLSGHQWIEQVRDDSEVAGYRTYYLATVTSHVGILVTFSVRRADADPRRPELDEMIESLVVYQRR